MAIEVREFEIGRVEPVLDRDLVAGLRALADALERGAMQGRLLSAAGIDTGPTTLGVMVRLVVSAPVQTRRRVVEELGQGGCDGR